MRAALKRLQRFACAALVAASFQGIQTAHADWANFGTVSMTDATHPKLINGYGCYTDGRDIVCDSATSPVSFGTGGLVTYGGMTVAGGISASAVSSTYVSATVLQINPSSMPCSTGLGGTIRYSATSNTLEVCTGTTWSTLSSNTTPGNLSGSGSATAIAYWNGANSLTYENSATSGLYWDHANGRIGIGTNSPVTTLTISGTSGLAFNSAAAKSISWYTGGGYPVQIRGDASNVNLAFLLSGREAARFNTAGNLGIATQSPTASLQVSGTFTVSNSTQAANAPSLYVGANGNVGVGTSSPTANFNVVGSGGSRIYLDDFNTVWAVPAIITRMASGTAQTPLAIPALSPLGFFGASGYDGSTYGSSAAGVWMGAEEAFTPTAHGAYFDIQTTEPSTTSRITRMQVTGRGSVGIGTITPNSSLTIVGEAQVGNSGAACVTANNGGAIRYSAGTLYYCNGSNTWSAISGGGAGFTGGGSATAIAFWNGPNSLTYESATTSGLYWDTANKRLGIGTNSPGYPLEISSSLGGIKLSRGGNEPFILFWDGTNDRATFQIRSGTQGGAQDGMIISAGGASPDWFRIISSTGNTGIGASTHNGFFPTATLQVSGTFLVSQTGQNTASAASMLVDSRGVSVSSIVHINGSAFSPIGAGGNAILSGTTAVSTSSAGSITIYSGGNQVMAIDSTGRVGIGGEPTANKLRVSGGNIRIDGTAAPAVYLSATTGDLYAFSGNTAIPGVGIWDNSTGVWPLSIKNTSGYVGLNTIAQVTRLALAGDSSGGTTWQRNGLSIVDTGASGRTYSLSSRGATGFALGDETAGVARMVIAPNGVVTFVGTSTCTLANGTGTTSCTSDRRLKDRIEPIRDPLDKLMLIKGVTYHWKRKDISKPEHIGVIAQDVEKAFPQAVTEVSDTTLGSAKTVDYSILVAPIIEALRVFKHQFDADHEELAKLKADNDNLRIQVDTQQKQIDALTAANDNIEALQKAVRDLQARDEPLRSVR